MHELFTRGVTPDGRLGATLEQAPNLYKESPLGWIPKDWVVKSCSEICEKITVGIVVRPTQHYTLEGIPAFRSANIRCFRPCIHFSESECTLVEEPSPSWKHHLSTNGIPRNKRSRAERVRWIQLCGCAHLTTEILCSLKLSVNWINSSFGKEQALRKQGGLAQQHFNVGELRDLRVVLPQMTEQDAVVDSLAVISARIETERSHIAKFRQLKHSLCTTS